MKYNHQEFIKTFCDNCIHYNFCFYDTKGHNFKIALQKQKCCLFHVIKKKEVGGKKKIANSSSPPSKPTALTHKNYILKCKYCGKNWKYIDKNITNIINKWFPVCLCNKLHNSDWKDGYIMVNY